MPTARDRRACYIFFCTRGEGVICDYDRPCLKCLKRGKCRWLIIRKG
jgi:hypothetical protein